MLSDFAITEKGSREAALSAYVIVHHILKKGKPLGTFSHIDIRGVL